MVEAWRDVDQRFLRKMEVITEYSVPEEFLSIVKQKCDGIGSLRKIYLAPGLLENYGSGSSVSAYDPDSGKIFIDLKGCIPPNYFAKLGACLTASVWFCLLHQFFLRMCMAKEIEAAPSLLEGEVPPEEVVVRVRQTADSELLAWAINGGTVPALEKLGWFHKVFNSARIKDAQTQAKGKKSFSKLVEMEEEALQNGGVASVVRVIKSGLMNSDENKVQLLLAAVKEGEIGVATSHALFLDSVEFLTLYKERGEKTEAVRVFELAKEFSLSPKKAAAILVNEGFPISSHMSKLSGEDENLAREILSQEVIFVPEERRLPLPHNFDEDVTTPAIFPFGEPSEDDPKINQRLSDWFAYLNVREKLAEDEVFIIKYEDVKEGASEDILEFYLARDEENLGEWETIEKARKCRIYLSTKKQFAGTEDFSNKWWIGNNYGFSKKKGVLKVKLNTEQQSDVRDITSRIPKQGVLFNDAYGTKREVERQRQGLDRLKKGYSRNKQLLKLLFEPSKASPVCGDRISLAALENDLLIPNLDSSQMAAVIGALNSNDIYLIKGPPGTGKTTVIAELCYQFVKRGLRVLISSQSNLAVDNALGKLVHHRLIKPIRVGNEENIEDEGEAFIESRVIPEWLKNTAEVCERSWKETRDKIKRAHEILLVKEKLADYLRISEEYETVKTEHDHYIEEKTAEAKHLIQKRESIKEELHTLNHEIEGLEQIRRFMEKASRPPRKWEKVPINFLFRWFREELEPVREKFKEIKKCLQELTPESAKGKNRRPLSLRINSLHPATICRKAFLLSRYADRYLTYEPDWHRLESVQATLEQLSKARGEAVAIQEKRKYFEDKLAQTKSDKIQTSQKINRIKEQISCLNNFLNGRAEFFSSVISDWVEKVINYFWDVLSGNDAQGRSVSLQRFPVYQDEWMPVKEVLGRVEARLRARIQDWRDETKRAWEQQNNYKELLHLKKMCEERKQKFCDALGGTNIGAINSIPENDPRIRAIITSKGISGFLVHDNYKEKVAKLFDRYWSGTSTDKMAKSFFEIVGPDSWEEKEKDRRKKGYAYFLTLTEVIDRYLPSLEKERTELITWARNESVKIRQGAKKIIKEETESRIRDLENNQKDLTSHLTRLENEERGLREQAQTNRRDGARVLENIDRLTSEAKALVAEIRKAENAFAYHKFMKLAEECINGDAFRKEPWNHAIKAAKNTFAKLADHQILFDLLASAATNTIEKGKKAWQDALEKKEDIDQRITNFTTEVNKRAEETEVLKDKADASGMEWEEIAGEHAELIKDIYANWDKEENNLEDKKTLKAVLKSINEASIRVAGLRSFASLYEPIAMEWLERINAPSEKDISDLRDIYIETANVVGATCSVSGSRKFLEKHSNFDVVIVDEVSKATLPELVLPCLAGEKIILIGDDKQLPPMIGPKTITELAEEMGSSPQELGHLEISFFAELLEAADEKQKTMLQKQYRMHPDIMGVINQFYEDKLDCGIPEPNETLKHGCGGELVAEDQHLLWIDIPKGGMFTELKEGTSFVNKREVEITKQVLDLLHKSWAENNDGRIKKVGIVTFYAAQAHLLEDLFDKHRKDYPFFDLRIGTVDRFQGMEREIIIVSMVRNNHSGNIGFAKKPERINVAFSRAKQLLVIIGCASLFCGDDRDFVSKSIYRKVAETVKEKGSFVADVSRLLKD